MKIKLSPIFPLRSLLFFLYDLLRSELDVRPIVWPLNPPNTPSIPDKMTFGDLKSDGGLKKLNDALANKSYVEG